MSVWIVGFVEIVRSVMIVESDIDGLRYIQLRPLGYIWKGSLIY